METSLALDRRLTLEHRPTPALVAYARLLAASCDEVERLVERELAENPALERADVPAPVLPGCGPAVDRGERGDVPSLLERLELEARLTLPQQDHPTLEYLLGSLDDHGFLPVAPEEIAAAVGTPASRVEAVLQLVRELAPIGLATPGVLGCLDAQLVRLDDDPAVVSVARRIVAGGLGDLAAGRYGALARRLGVPRELVVDARDLIRRRTTPYPVLDRPLRRGVPEPGSAPDVLILHRPEEPDGLRIDLAEEHRCALRVSASYVRAPDVGTAAQVERAHAFLRRLGDRWGTLRLVAEHTARAQRAMVLRGPGAARPLTRAQVAGALGIHESTVSRAVAGRSALLPCGRVVALSAFFTPALAPQERLRQLVAAEGRPLSDGELAAKLTAEGLPVARRTVAKYRGLLDIAPCAQRSRGEGVFAGDRPGAKRASRRGAAPAPALAR